MRECICESCSNLKAVLDEEGAPEAYECEFGYPSEDCESCVTFKCELTCDHFTPDEEEPVAVTVTCSVCGKELTQMLRNAEEGTIRCIDCFLKESR